MPFYFIFVIFTIIVSLNFLVRLVLVIGERGSLASPISDSLLIFSAGLFNDFLFFSFFLILPVLYFTFLPRSLLIKPGHKIFLRIVTFLSLLIFVFIGHCEWFFWNEFQSRFNFIAVDYLVYTQVVVGNIVESYPMNKVYTSVLLISVFGFFIFRKWIDQGIDALQEKTLSQRLREAVIYLTLPPLAFFVFADMAHGLSTNRVNDQLARNGPYEAFSAFRKNSLNYEAFFLKQDVKDVFSQIVPELTGVNGEFHIDDQGKPSRAIVNPGPEKRHNVIFILVESLSANYMGTFGNKENITPYLDRIAKESLLFKQLYSTGTRTVRGIEAVTLSLPPTPGYSVVKRPGNENMFSIGPIFQGRGYDTKFIYGGYGFFDNMNYFFGHNGFDVIDRNMFDADKVSFANIWGVADEDLFDMVLNESEKSFSKNLPFFNFVLTTSNHRPYTYPEGRIDIPSKTGREGAVKYTDYAIGTFLEKAKQHAWFDNTIFVIIADHCAAGRGKTNIPIQNYHIPMMIYAPKIITPGAVETLASQIDVAPTILGLLNFSYASKFFGKDILKMNPSEQRLVLGTYQNLGYFRDGTLVTLSPPNVASYETYDPATRETRPAASNETRLHEAINYYQYASYLLKHRFYGWETF